LLTFPTALVAESGHEPGTKLRYIGTMATSSALLGLLAWAVGRDRSLRDTDAKPDPTPAVATVLAFGVALGVSLLVPEASAYPLLLLLLTDPGAHRWRRARA
jgi:hypothetical protein